MGLHQARTAVSCYILGWYGANQRMQHDAVLQEKRGLFAYTNNHHCLTFHAEASRHARPREGCRCVATLKRTCCIACCSIEPQKRVPRSGRLPKGKRLTPVSTAKPRLQSRATGVVGPCVYAAGRFTVRAEGSRTKLKHTCHMQAKAHALHIQNADASHALLRKPLHAQSAESSGSTKGPSVDQMVYVLLVVCCACIWHVMNRCCSYGRVAAPLVWHARGTKRCGGNADAP
jgi:hypothetical protein